MCTCTWSLYALHIWPHCYGIVIRYWCGSVVLHPPTTLNTHPMPSSLLIFPLLLCCRFLNPFPTEMEDAHSVQLNFAGDPDSAYFGVFDGHGGQKFSNYCSKQLHHHLQDEKSFSMCAYMYIMSCLCTLYTCTCIISFGSPVHTCSLWPVCATYYVWYYVETRTYMYTCRFDVWSLPLGKGDYEQALKNSFLTTDRRLNEGM